MNLSDTYRSPMGDLGQTYPTPNGLPIRFDNGFTLTNVLTDGRTHGLTNSFQDSGSKSHVPDPENPVDNSDCLCFEVEDPWTYYGIVEPGGALEPNHDCPVHFPEQPEPKAEVA